MLGIPELELEVGGFNRFFHKFYMDMRAKGKEPPFLTILPSFWHDGVNSVTVIDRFGRIIGRQKKRKRFYYRSQRCVEALQESDPNELLIIHVTGLHRIAITICADFLMMEEQQLKELLCAELGVTMLVVPSYSQGEQDFMNGLLSLARFGTTVIWGDCCGAVKPSRIIGSCGVAGTDIPLKFGRYCKCGFSCKGRQSCVFLAKIPQIIIREKPGSPDLSDAVEHILV